MAPQPLRIERMITRVTLLLLVFFSGAALAAVVLLLPHGSMATNVARIAVPIAVTVACIAAYFLARRGHPRKGAVLVVSVAYAGILNYTIVAELGLHSYAVSLYVLLIIVTSLLIGHRAGIWTSALTIATVIVLFAAERSGLIVDSEAVRTIPPANIAVVYCILLGATGAVLFLVSRAFHDTLRAAYREEHRFRQLMELAPLGQVVHRADRILMVNRVAALSGGYDRPEELIGLSIYGFVPEDKRALAMQRMAEARLAAAGTHVRFEYGVTDRSGRSRVFESLTAPLELADGPALLTLMRDVTKERNAIAELATAKAQAEAASVAKSQFLANMSHEIRTPMNAVMGLSELLLASELSAQQRERIAGIHRSAQALLRVINDILDVSRIEAGRMELVETRFEPRRLLSEVRDLLEPLAREKSLSMVLEIGHGVPVAVLGDEGRLRQIVVNLAGNAVKFTERGEVRLELEALEAAQGAARLRVRVSDTGVGMSAEQLENVFAPFMQLDAASTRKYGGTGLGLYIAREFAQLLGGTLEVKSTPGKGSMFELQVALRVAQAEAALPAAPESAPGAKRSVLLVEDNEVNQEVARAMLEAGGHQVEVAGDGSVAVNRCAAERYDCVLMDCQMPGMDGFEATRRIRAAEAGDGRGCVPIVALTANAMSGDRERCLAAGMDDFLSKPFDTAALLAAVARNARRAAFAEAPARAPASFDPAALEELVSIDRETPGFLARLTARYLEGTPVLIASVAGAADATAKEAGRAAHTVKSTSLRFGANALAELAAKAEAAVREGDLGTVRELAETMRTEFDRAAGLLQQHPALARRMTGD